MRPPTHDDPDAVPRNGTDVPWVDLEERLPRPPEPQEPAGEEPREVRPRVAPDPRA